MKNRHLEILMILTGLSTMLAHAANAAPPVDFNRDIRPILAEHCYFCHGPDPETREADLRLDLEAGAKAAVIVPGNISESELIRRVVSTDPDEQMPPADFGKDLKAEQVELLKRWVSEGGQWAGHWSFERPVKDKASLDGPSDWVRNPIDEFVLARLSKENLQPSAEADRATLARRLSFDLTGLPPDPDRLAGFLADESPEAYEHFVDELLASPHYGERMAMVWLDAARYADSDGYQADATRQNWPWRDWVIDAYNSNMPFDQFTVEQFAGDLLDDASQEQILATCFHRNHMHNGEGGRDPEESRIEYVRDRVNTIGTVWLGLTLECAQCHSHKYDPVSQHEYYALNAFFNSIDENGKAGGGAGPFLKYTSQYVREGLDDSISWLQQTEAGLQKVREEELGEFEDWLQQRIAAIAATDGHESWRTGSVISLQTTSPTNLTESDGVYSVTGADPRHDDYLVTVSPERNRVTAMRLKVFPSANAKGRLSRHADGHIILTNLKIRRRSADGSREADLPIRVAVADYEAAKSGRIYGPVATVLDDDPRTGWMTTGSQPDAARSAAFVFESPLELGQGESLVVELRQRSLRGYSNLQRFRLEFTDESQPAATSLNTTPLEELAKIAAGEQPESAAIPDKLRQRLQAQFLADRPRVLKAEADVAKAKRRKGQYDAASKPQSVTVLKQRAEPRQTHVLVRGVWNSKGDVVTASTPAAIRSGDASARNRLDLAKWLVQREHPLTARVAVNRYWQMYFGAGLVRTPGDFGVQGEPPTHPGLLDWLAVEFMDSGWDVKHLQRLIVTSAVYRQTSDVTSQLLERDPGNRLLARASRFRYPSWMIRDAALAVSGLLARRIGGPPVFAFQPEGAWLDATMGRFRYEPSVGNDLYRRSLYTFWRRSVGPTGMFDASKRRNCEVRSVRTNTPLHALNLMNDQTYVQAAQRIAEDVMATPRSAEDAIVQMFVRALYREPTIAEKSILYEQWNRHVIEFTSTAGDTTQNRLGLPLQQGASRDVNMSAAVMVATTILNLDEALTHE